MRRWRRRHELGDVEGGRVVVKIFHVVRRRCMREGGPFFEYYANTIGWTDDRRKAAPVHPHGGAVLVSTFHGRMPGVCVVRVVQWRRLT